MSQFPFALLPHIYAAILSSDIICCKFHHRDESSIYLSLRYFICRLALFPNGSHTFSQNFSAHHPISTCNIKIGLHRV
ncbi:hypothetical protein SCHPADRAFT_582695 [Schizopora paradoxa]|uniref:Uncharacterized protein n=1 Tax=Schizopora paradoxa TaxID=27342 RepID=A0A0H2RBA8_9AGAM|nr:hypothetical protein SCHPADRAFT_582695 [Schizopora paradoxa]